ncbi:hypothetical protein RJ639_020902 [Escallonia herrerae]|uniref:DC1 domain-containing protein n=1 Tax=Escallonia herrerae TaxID=1293975 RepID=A0AA88V790_9ASTE|nr:hypothetical protein RJ639_020902 [Escallonia herrerae]
MAPLQKPRAPAGIQTLQHFTHPKHPLLRVYMAMEFNCDGCNTLGSGTRYRCHACDFDLHERCATCPFALPSHVQPQHQLTLVNQTGKAHFCNLCGDIADGIFYTCRACDFDVHPLCTQLPLTVRYAPHPQHLLMLQPGNPSSWCSFCRQPCKSWRYTCQVCGVDVHLDCVLAPPSDVPRGPAATWVPPLPLTYGGCAVGVPSSSGYGVNQEAASFHGQARGVDSSGSNGKKINSVVGKLAVKALVSSMIGFPVGF